MRLNLDKRQIRKAVSLDIVGGGQTRKVIVHIAILLGNLQRIHRGIRLQWWTNLKVGVVPTDETNQVGHSSRRQHHNFDPIRPTGDTRRHHRYGFGKVRRLKFNVLLEEAEKDANTFGVSVALRDATIEAGELVERIDRRGGTALDLHC